MLQFLLDHQTTALTMLASFGGGALAHRIALILGWLKSPQGQALEGDLKAAAPIVLKALADSDHPASPAAIKTINTVLNALPDASVASSAPKVGALLLACLLGAACLRADVVPVAPTTETGLAGIVGLAGATGLYQLSDGGKFVSTSESIAGAQYSLCWGTYSLAADRSLDFSALWYMAGGVGCTAGLGNEYGAAWLALGYEDLGALIAWNVGTGQPPLVGAQIKIPLHDLALTHGLDATFGNAHKLGAW